MARKKKKRIASRGSVNNIILRTLVSGDKYGYEIIKEVEEFSGGKIQLKQPSLYSSLSRFEEKHYVTSYWGDSEIGGRRHYYHLTEQGNEYYRKVVLKEDDESVEDIDEDNEDVVAENADDNSQFADNEIDGDVSTLDSESEADNENLNNEVEEEWSNTNLPINDTEEVSYTEINEDEIPAIADFEKHEEDTPVIIPDHAFYTHTPIENLIDSKRENNLTIESEKEIEEQDENQAADNTQEFASKESTSPIKNEKPWLELSSSTKVSNSKISNTNFKTLYTKKPKKVQKVILDKDGIYKLRDEDYVPIKRSNKPVIIDNVGKRTKDNNVFGYTSYTETKPKETKVYPELSDEEKRKRNENFLAKFNLITNSKMKPISTPTPKPIEKEPEKPIDYRGKLDAIVENTKIVEDEDDPFVDLGEEENNIFNYDNSPQWSTPTQEEDIATDSDDGEINFEPEEEFETKTTDSQYIENINTYSPNNDIKISRYENKSKAILVDKTYILINKLKFVFGIIMTLIMVAEMTISYLLFQKNGVIFDGDMAVIIVGYVLVGLFALFTILPYIFNHKEHKANNFKFKYSIVLGLLTFLVLAILIYCFNALAGFELDNFKYFTVKLLVPLILSSNMFVAPLVYGLLNKNKTFYD